MRCFNANYNLCHFATTTRYLYSKFQVLLMVFNIVPCYWISPRCYKHCNHLVLVSCFFVYSECRYYLFSFPLLVSVERILCIFIICGDASQCFGFVVCNLTNIIDTQCNHFGPGSVAERLALPTSDHGVAGSNPTGSEILPEPERRFIAQSLSCSPFHRLEMTEILLKGRKTLTHPSNFGPEISIPFHLNLGWRYVAITVEETGPLSSATTLLDMEVLLSKGLSRRL